MINDQVIATLLDLKSPQFGSRLEVLVQALYESILQPGDAAIDGGASTGHHTFPMARAVGTAGRVVAVEPLSRPIAELRRVAAESGATNVEIVQGALACEPGLANFTAIGELDGYSGLRETPWVPSELPRTSLEVVTYTLDEISARLPRLAAVKLDLEGGEYHALLGAPTMLSGPRPVVVMECGGDNTGALYGYDYDMVAAFLAGIGYTFYDLFGRPMTRARWVGIPTETPPDGFIAPHRSEAEARMLACLPAAARRALELFP